MRLSYMPSFQKIPKKEGEIGNIKHLTVRRNTRKKRNINSIVPIKAKKRGVKGR